jgi:hypothetical protein
MRKRIEELFGEAKEFMGFRTAKFRLRRFLREQVLMTATAQNIKRMVKLLSLKGPKNEAGVVEQPLSTRRLSFLFLLAGVYREKRIVQGMVWGAACVDG